MLKVDHLTKKYGDFTAVDDVDFEITPGEVVGLLGPNGSGKTSMLRVISTYFLPTKGSVLVDGIDVAKDPLEARKRLGYLPESNILYEQMRVDKFLLFAGEAKGLYGKALKNKFEQLVEEYGMGFMLRKKCGECSRGMRQKVAFAAAAINDPKVMLLDEPTAGLDPVQSYAFRNNIKAMAQNKVILFSSHILSEVVSVANRVLIIHNSHLLADFTFPEGEKNAEKLESFFLDTIKNEEAILAARKAGPQDSSPEAAPPPETAQPESPESKTEEPGGQGGAI